MDANGKVHKNPETVALLGMARIFVLWGPPNLTHKYQPVDHSIGKSVREWMLGDDGLRGWIESSTKRSKAWRRGAVRPKTKRMLAVRWLGRAWSKMHGPYGAKAIHHAWRSTGCGLTASGAHDEQVKPEGMSDYVPPPVGEAVPPPHWLPAPPL